MELAKHQKGLENAWGSQLGHGEVRAWSYKLYAQAFAFSMVFETVFQGDSLSSNHFPSGGYNTYFSTIHSNLWQRKPSLA